MASSKIYRGKTVQEAIQLALNELKVSRSEVEVEVINQPKKYLFGMITALAEIKVTLKEQSEEIPEKTNNTPGAGLIGVKNGQLVYTPAKSGGPPPRIFFDNSVIVFYNGNPVRNSVLLETGIDGLDIQLPADRTPNTTIDIEISDDKLEAILRVNRILGVSRRIKDCEPANIMELVIDEQTTPAPIITIQEIKRQVESAGITYGIDYTVLTEELLQENNFEVVIAKGREPIYPIDGVIEFLFPLDSERSVDLEAERIDHLELNLVPNVEKGEPLAKKSLPVAGQTGINIFGGEINVGSPKSPEIRIGEGVVLSEDQLTAFADQPGRPVLQNGELKVLNIYELNGDVDLGTGNIRFNGEIIIRGNVAEQLKVEAFSGGIQIYGMVTHAQIKASRDIVISKNAIASRIAAGGDAIAFLKVSSFLNELSGQVSSLLSSFYTVAKRQPETSHGRLVKKLLEIKYNDLPKKIMEFDQLFSESKNIFENGLFLLINSMKAVFLGRGPLELTDISIIEIIRSDLLHWKNFYKDASEETADITVSYLQNSVLEASGNVRVIGQGAYYSKIIAGQGYYQSRGVFRGGEISVEEGNIQVKEVGGPTGIVTLASIVRDGRMSIGLVHPNVTVSIGNQKYRFEQQTSSVRVFQSKEGLEVFSGSINLMR